MSTSVEKAASLSKIRPIHLVYETELTSPQQQAVEEGIAAMLHVAETKLAVHPNTGFETKEILENETYITLCKQLNAPEGTIDADVLGEFLKVDVLGPKGEGNPQHYAFWILASPTYSNFGDERQPNYEQINGKGLEGVGAFVSLDKFLQIDLLEDQTGMITTYVQHELGHVFGLVPKTRAVENRHCQDDACIMLPRIPLYQKLGSKELSYSQLCTSCQDDLKSYFS